MSFNELPHLHKLPDLHFNTPGLPFTTIYCSHYSIFYITHTCNQINYDDTWFCILRPALYYWVIKLISRRAVVALRIHDTCMCP